MIDASIMSDTSVLTSHKQTADVAKPVGKAKKSPVRAATLADVNLIHARLMEAIETSPYYTDRFKTYEKEHMSKRYLRTLIALDPYHILVIVADNKPAGFMITSPQYGALWLQWSYIFPEMRRASLALAGLRALIAHWDNGRYHKISTYTKDGNPAVALLKRFKFSLIANLENHMFGEDYLLYEFPLTKTKEGYDRGTSMGRLGRFKARFRAMFNF